MAKNIFIKNEDLTVEISTLGAELQSVICDGKEQIWQGDPKFWSGRSPILFPICGELLNNAYDYQGKHYDLRKHGFASIMEFEIEELASTYVTFLLKSNEQTLKSYPFEFEFRVKYNLTGRKMTVIYETYNPASEDMYFSVGAHESYACPEGIENYKLVFDMPENFNCATFTKDKVIGDEFIDLGQSTRELNVTDEIFNIGALMFLDLKSRGVTLVNKTTGEGRRLEYPGFDYFFVWSRPYAAYLCLEPWRGVPDFANGTGNFNEKRGINKLGAKEKDVTVHTIVY